MDIKATQLKNDRVEDTSSSIRMAAKVAENGKSFIDEMIDLPKINTENNLKQSSPENKHVEQKFGNDNKSFEFISKSSNSFSSAMNKENMSLQERQAKHKAAEKELVDEIVLMNNKQISQAKEGIKNDLNKAQISVAKKSDEQINEENQEIKNELKSFDIKNQKDESENLRFVSPENIKMTENIEQEIFLPENNQIEEIEI